MYKYRINELLSELPMKDYRKALKILPAVLGVSSNTLFNYRNIRLDDEKDIPYQKVAALEKIFNLKPGALANFHIDCKSIDQLLKDSNEQT